MKDPEIEAMLTCTKSLEKLDLDAKRRVIDYLISRFEIVTSLGDITQKEKEVLSLPEVKNNKKNKTKLNSKTKSSKNSSKSLQSYKMINDLNLYPKDKENLKDFYSNYVAKTFFDKNLLYVFYMERTLGIEGITVDHVYTCYKTTSQKVPGNLYQSLADTRKLKAWIDTKNMNDLKVAVPGENRVDHEIPKSDINDG